MRFDIDFRGKRALVCGSTQGIGKACAEILAELGAEVVLMARNKDKLINLSQSLASDAGQQHGYIVADFDQPEELKKTLSGYLEKEGAFDMLINNTGGPPAGPILEANIEAFESAIRQHLHCNHLITQALVPGMKKRGGGRIVNIISTSVKIPLPGLGVSNTTRGAVANWAKTLSYELAKHKITINNVLPGYTNTGRLDGLIENKVKASGVDRQVIEDQMNADTPMGRFASPDEVANAVVFLSSPAASYINGVSLPVDGGRTGSH